MKYLDYKEIKQQGTFEFPIAFYHLDSNHPRYHMPYHWHTEYELVRVIEGTFRMNLEGESYSLKPGDVAFITEGLLHGGTPEHCIYECIVFDIRILFRDNKTKLRQLQRILDREITIHTILNCRIEPYITIINNLFSSIREKRVGYELVVLGSLYMLLGHLLEADMTYSNPTHSTIALHHSEPIKRVLSYIEDNYSNCISLECMADIAGMSPKYLCKYFRAMTSKTPIEYLNYYRIECAREQISTTDMTITNIALGCGFNDISYFIKLFKRHFGITPKQYSKMNFI